MGLPGAGCQLEGFRAVWQGRTWLFLLRRAVDLELALLQVHWLPWEAPAVLRLGAPLEQGQGRPELPPAGAEGRRGLLGNGSLFGRHLASVGPTPACRGSEAGVMAGAEEHPGLPLSLFPPRGQRRLVPRALAGSCPHVKGADSWQEGPFSPRALPPPTLCKLSVKPDTNPRNGEGGSSY